MSEANGSNPTDGLKDLAGFIVERLASARTIDLVAAALVEKLNVQQMKPLIKEIALRVELEREQARKTGLAAYAIKMLREKGIRLDVAKGQLHAGPPRLVTDEVKKIIWALKADIIRELSQ